jgi:hypothetical protein
MYLKKLFTAFTCTIIVIFSAFDAQAFTPPTKVIIIRHAEKPEKGQNLSCQGMNRAAALPAVLHQKFGTPEYTYVPAMGGGKKGSHLRMFQTVSPFATQYNLKVNTKYKVNDTQDLAQDIMRHNGTVLVVWEHDAINNIAKALGVDHPGKWSGDDFDSIWIITFQHGKAVMQRDTEGLHPSTKCK